MNKCAGARAGVQWGGPGSLAFYAIEAASEYRYRLLYFGLELDNILHTGMFLTGINDHLVKKLVLQVSVSSCFRGKTRL